MKYLKSINEKFSYNQDDLILIHYWYDNMIVPVKIVEKIGNKYKVSHNVSESKIQNAPDEIIYKHDIIDLYRK